MKPLHAQPNRPHTLRGHWNIYHLFLSPKFCIKSRNLNCHPNTHVTYIQQENCVTRAKFRAFVCYLVSCCLYSSERENDEKLIEGTAAGLQLPRAMGLCPRILKDYTRKLSKFKALMACNHCAGGAGFGITFREWYYKCRNGKPASRTIPTD